VTALFQKDLKKKVLTPADFQSLFTGRPGRRKFNHQTVTKVTSKVIEGYGRNEYELKGRKYEIVFKAISTCNIGLMGKKLSCTDDILRVRNQKILACTSDITSQFGPASF
jgi:hypothetical protein